MTALGGMVLLMEGSTIKDGKYADNIRKAVDWFMEPGRCQRNGLIGNPNNPRSRPATCTATASAYCSCPKFMARKKTPNAARSSKVSWPGRWKFTGKAQTNRGGWGYVSANDGGGFDEGSVTVTQVQALRAARDAGVPVPRRSSTKRTSI